MTTVSIHEAKTNLSRLIAEVEAGGEIIIARASKPVARLSGLQPPTRRQPGLLKHLCSMPPEAFAPMTDEDLVETFATRDF